MPLSTNPRPVIRCFNVKYSPNLGDGLLSECLEQGLIEQGADPATSSIDLAARQAYGDTMAGRGAIMQALDAMPGPLRKLAVRAPLALASARKWRPHYAAGLAGADGVAVGGGNLLADLDLNFPTKLSLAVDTAAAQGLPIAIYACGVSAGWSATALKWCRRSFARPELKAVFVRDEASRALFDDMFAKATGQQAQVVRDPGLLAARYFPASPREPGARPVAGLNIMSHIAIRYHTANAPALARLDQFYIEVARGLIAAGFQVRVFTNGSPEDQAYAAELHNRLRALGGEERIAFLDQRDPAGLCAHIAAFDVLIAYRMHAVIAAYSYGIPTLALAWDRKLASFMDSVGQGDWLFDVAAISPAECVEQAQQAYAAGLPRARHAQVLAEAQADLGKLWQCFAPVED